MPAAYRPLARPLRIDPRWAVGNAAIAGIFAGPANAIAIMLSLAALAAALERRHVAMLLWYGIALVFSAESLLVAPFVAALLFNRRFAWRAWPFAPLAAACGFLALVRLATMLATTPFTALTAGAPNLWAIAAMLPIDTSLIGLAVASLVGATAVLTAYFSARALDDRTTLSAAAFTSLIMAELLPGADASCVALPAAIAVLHAACGRDRRALAVALLVCGGWALAASGYPATGGLATVVATLLLAARLFRMAANDNHIWPILARTG